MRAFAIAALLGLSFTAAGCAYLDEYGAADPYGRPDPRYDPRYDPSYDPRDDASDRYGRGDRYGDYDYADRDYARDTWRDRQLQFEGPGAQALDPWLALTPEGRQIVARQFTLRGNWIDERTAEDANRWFRTYADTNRDRRLTDAEIRIALAHASR